jgi:tetratricopeptide (TPR) repeat protein
MAFSPLCWRSALVLGTLLIAACSNPDNEKVEHVKRGDQYVTEKRDDFAVIEYASALRLDPKYGEAHFKLAQTYERMNNMRLAFPEYIRAADALPDDRDAQVKASQLLLAAGRFEDAKSRAAKILEKDPKDVDGLLLQAGAMAGLQDPAGAVTQIEEALKVSPDSSQAFLNLGVVRLQTGQSKEAEAAFRRAVDLAPSTVNPKLALANFLWAAGRGTEAEASIEQALTIEPQNLLANRMLALIYLLSNRPNEAEAPLKVVADVSKAPRARFQLVDYYINANRKEAAKTLLTSLSSDQESFAEAEARLATIDYDDGKIADAHKRLDAARPHAQARAGTRTEGRLAHQGRQAGGSPSGRNSRRGLRHTASNCPLHAGQRPRPAPRGH